MIVESEGDAPRRDARNQYPATQMTFSPRYLRDLPRWFIVP